jgi:hypothetical protein
VSKITTTCPQATRTQNHRKRLHKWWASKQWKSYVKKHTEGKSCKECGCVAGQIKGERKPAVLTINHLYRDCYNSFEDYLKFEADRAEVTCTTCNWMFEKGKNICPECFSDTVAKYKPWNQPTCSACFLKANPEINEAREKRKQESKDLQKKLRKEQSDGVKAWKKAHPLAADKSRSETYP